MWHMAALILPLCRRRTASPENTAYLAHLSFWCWLTHRVYGLSIHCGQDHALSELCKDKILINLLADTGRETNTAVITGIKEKRAFSLSTLVYAQQIISVYRIQ